jgi:hypothetical protein
MILGHYFLGLLKALIEKREFFTARLMLFIVLAYAE